MARHDDSEEYPNLPHAPITEALIDYRVQARDDITPASFSDVAKMFAASFPDAGRIEAMELFK